MHVRAAFVYANTHRFAHPHKRSHTNARTRARAHTSTHIHTHQVTLDSPSPAGGWAGLRRSKSDEDLEGLSAGPAAVDVPGPLPRPARLLPAGSGLRNAPARWRGPARGAAEAQPDGSLSRLGSVPW